MKTFGRGLLLLAVMLSFILSSSASAGVKIKVEEGTVAGLLAHKNILVEYSYEGLIVGKKDEGDYTSEKVAAKNEDEAGAGDAWLAAWKGDRESRYQPKFEELMNKYLAEQGVTVSATATAPDAVMLVHVTRIEPGYYIGISSAPSLVDMRIQVVDPADRSQVKCEITLLKAPGASVDTGSRISESFAKAGKDLAKYLVKKGG